MLLVMDILSYLKYFVTVELLSWLLAQFQIIHNILEEEKQAPSLAVNLFITPSKRSEEGLY